jgi:hypothetical protein
MTLARADLLVWLDLSRTRVVTQLLSRTMVRRYRHVELWNGNYEPPLHTIFTDPEHVVRWAWGSYARIGPRVQDVRAQPDHPVVVRLRSRREIRPVARAGGVNAARPAVVARVAPVASPRTTVRGGSGGCGCSVSTRG